MAMHRMFQNVSRLARKFYTLISERRLVAGFSASMRQKPVTDRRSTLSLIQATDGISWLVLVVSLPFTVVQFTRAAENQLPPLRPPAVPLVTHDPYFSIWSPSNKLTDADTVHWSGKPHRLTSLVRIDGKAFRVMGKEPAKVPALPQTNLEVLPTRTIYTFEGEGVRLTLTFMTPALPEDLEVLARPVTYVTWAVRAIDGQAHVVQTYFEASPEIVVNDRRQEVKRNYSLEVSKLRILAVSSVEQPTLQKKGDDLRIDWGTFLVAAPNSLRPIPHYGWTTIARQFFVKGRKTGVSDFLGASEVENASLTFQFEQGHIQDKSISRWLMLAYDDEFSIQYFKKNLRPYWRRNGDDAAALLKKAAADYESLKRRCAAFDTEMMADLTKTGGPKYAQLCALAYRQCLAGNKIVADRNGQPLMFPKENSSSGMMSTVGVSYPMSPQFLLLSPTLLKAALVPILAYSSSGRWPWPYAPHELGRYPIANGPTYDGGEDRGHPMPVEDTGNILIMLTALAHIEGNADFCQPWWPLLEKWAGYLKTNGFDPEKQLSGDDFAGAIAHHTDLSVKSICALGGFARLCELRGDKAKAAEWLQLAKDFAARWVKQADDGDHFRLAFDQPGTWSQKYNLVWDRILGLNLFPDSVREQEMKFYRTKLNEFGLPLDSRDTYTKLDWTLWSATLTQNRDDFDALVNPVWRLVNEMDQRVPLSDWVLTQRAALRDFQARPVVGAFFLQMLYDSAVWKKWSARDTNRPANWAAILKPPKLVEIVPTAEKEPVQWRYTTQPPREGWNQASFDDSGWKEGPAGFGIKGAKAATVRTEWNAADIWLRREITMPEGKWTDLSFRLYRSSDVQIYLNGVLAATFPGYVSDYQQVRVKGKARLAIKPGKNIIALHAGRTALPQCFDVGIVDVRDADE